MNGFWLYRIHSIFGEMVLPIFILAALVATAWTWSAAPGRPKALRILAVLVDIQFTLGLAWWIYGLASGFGAGRGYLRFPFLLHPLCGLFAAAAAHLAAKPPAKMQSRRAVIGMTSLLLAAVLAAIFAGKWLR